MPTENNYLIRKVTKPELVEKLITSSPDSASPPAAEIEAALRCHIQKGVQATIDSGKILGKLYENSLILKQDKRTS